MAPWSSAARLSRQISELPGSVTRPGSKKEMEKQEGEEGVCQSVPPGLAGHKAALLATGS